MQVVNLHCELLLGIVPGFLQAPACVAITVPPRRVGVHFMPVASNARKNLSAKKQCRVTRAIQITASAAPALPISTLHILISKNIDHDQQ
jgi:hypothetical protein